MTTETHTGNETKKTDEPKVDQSTERGDQFNIPTPPRSEEGKVKTGPEAWYQKRAIKIGGAVAAVLAALAAGIGIGANSGNNAEPKPTPTATAPANPSPSPAATTPEASPSASPSETAQSSSDVVEFQLPNGNTYKMPTAMELAAMSPEEKLEAVRLPEGLMEDREALYITHHKMKEVIYNSVASDEVYREYLKTGGVDYPTHIMDTIVPLLEQLSGELDESALQGAKNTAFTIANVLGSRVDDGFTDLFSPYYLSVGVLSVEKDSPSRDITGTISVKSSFDQAESDALEDITGYRIAPQDERPFTARLTKIRYNQELETVQAVSIQLKD